MNKKLIRITTVPMALKYLLPGQMHFMQQNGFEVLMISAEGKELEDVKKNEGCRHIIVPMTRTITPFQDLKCLFQLIRIFLKEKPDIVHTHTPKAGLLGMLAAKICFVKVRIHTVAGLPLMVEKGFKLQLLKLVEKLTYATANNVWPNSYSLKKYIIQHKLAHPDKLSVIAKGSTNGINVDRFNKQALDEDVYPEVKKSIRFSSDIRYLLCIGRLVKDKGIVELVTAFTQLSKNNRELRLILVGDFEAALDPLPKHTLKEIETNCAIIHISWTHYVEYYMALSDIFIFPSHREGFPNVLLQAGALQLPILCSKIPGNIDIVVHQETGLLFEKENIEQIVNNIEYALINYSNMKIMAANLYTQVNKDYRRENIWCQILEKYQSLLTR